MKDLRFTGYINGDYVDVTLRTDMIGATDTNFNITQIQEGEQFATTDKQGGMYQKHMSTIFKETNNTYATAYDFAVDNGLNLRLIAADGTVTNVVHDHSDSISDFN